MQLGDDGTGHPLVHLQFIDSTRLVTNAGYYDFFPADSSQPPVEPNKPDYSYNPADPNSPAPFNAASPLQGQAMLAWSKQDFLASRARWQIVVPHHTTYGPGATFDNLSTKAYNTNPILISYLSSLNGALKAADPAKALDFVINGDSHYYCRVLEQEAVAGGVGLGIPIITLGNGGIRPASINLVPYGTPVNAPVNLGNYKPQQNGSAKLNPVDGLAMPASRPVSAGASGYYSYTRANGNQGTVSRVLENGCTYQFNLPVYNYGATARNYEADTGTDVSGLYGYGQGAAITEVDPDYFLLRFHTVDVLDPAITSLAPQGVEVGRGSSFYNDWSPTTAKLDDLALFSFDVDAYGRVSGVALAQKGTGYMESSAGAAEVIYRIPGNNPASTVDPQQAQVKLTFTGGSLTGVALVDGGSGYNLAANALQQQNGYVPVESKPAGATNTPTSGILIGLNIELEEQYALAAKAPDDQPLYADWYLQAETEAIATAASASAQAPFGALSLQVQPRSARARALLASRSEADGGLSLTTGYSGSGQQAAYATAQQGAITLIDTSGAQVSSSGDQLNAGLAQVGIQRLPAPGPLTVRFAGDPLSSYLAHYRPSDTALSVDFGRWSCGASAVTVPLGSQRLPALELSQPLLVSVLRNDSQGGQVSLTLVAQGASTAAPQVLLQQAMAASPQALRMERVFRSGSTGWQGSEGAPQGGGAVLATPLAAGTWLPEASRNGLPLALTGLEVVGNAVQASFEGGVQALLTLAGTGSVSTPDAVTGVTVTVRRLAQKQNGLAFYEADPLTGALLTGPSQGLLPGQSGYVQAALALAVQAGLVRQASQLPAFGQEAVLTNLNLQASRNYGLLLLVDDNPATLFSSYAAANPSGQAQFQAFAAPGRGLTYGIEDLAVAGGRSDRDFNDLIVSLSAANPQLAVAVG